MAVKQHLVYRKTVAEGAGVTTEPTPEVVKVIVPYPALVKAVELLVGGRMMHGHASTLAKGGWAYKMTCLLYTSDAADE